MNSQLRREEFTVQHHIKPNWSAARSDRGVAARNATLERGRPRCAGNQSRQSVQAYLLQSDKDRGPLFSRYPPQRRQPAYLQFGESASGQEERMNSLLPPKIQITAASASWT